MRFSAFGIFLLLAIQFNTAASAEAPLTSLIENAAKDLKVPGGAQYDENATVAIGHSLATAMKKCIDPKRKKESFDIVFVISETGSITRADRTPESETGKCVLTSVGKLEFPKPPFAPFHLRLQISTSN